MRVKHYCTIALKFECCRKHRLKRVHQRGLTIEVHRVLRGRRFFPGDAKGAAALRHSRDVRGLAPFERFFQRADTGGFCRDIKDQFAQREQAFSHAGRIRSEGSGNG